MNFYVDKKFYHDTIVHDLFSAILASIGAGIHGSVHDAVKAMVREVNRIEPDQEIHEAYTKIFDNVYSKLSSSVAPLVHAIHDIRGGSSTSEIKDSTNKELNKEIFQPNREESRRVIVSPSLLACDWADIRGEINKCIDANTLRLHIDMFDGVFLNSPLAFTFGPPMVAAMRGCSRNIILDVHLCVNQPGRYVIPLADAGASRLIFQYEAMDSVEDALSLIQSINDAGMKCGISINPDTEVENIYSLLDTDMIDTVNILAVEPGFGGQNFNDIALIKVEKLKQWRNEGEKTHLKFIVDGGINSETVTQVIDAGADILVSGSFLFNHPLGIKKGIEELLCSR